MSEVIHFVVVAIKIGFLGCLAIAVVVYVFASTESGCWHPGGCIDPAQVQAQDEQDRILRSWGQRWGA